MEPLLSVIVPNYNMATYFPDALESALSQTFKNFEIIFIDDCSIDNSLSVIEKISLKDCRIIVLKNPQNRGAVFTINRGIKEARGRYLYFLAADDKLLDNSFFENAIQLLELHPAFPMCTSDHAMFLDGSKEIHAWQVFPHFDSSSLVEADKYVDFCRQGLTKYWLFAMGTIFRKDAFLENGSFSADLPVLTDWYLIHRLALKSGFVYLPGVYVAWRHRGGNNNLYNHMKKNEVITLLKKIAKTKEIRVRFNHSRLLGCYVKQSLLKIALRPYLWNFIWPFAKDKAAKLFKKSKLGSFCS